jgi:hypothetical protein
VEGKGRQYHRLGYMAEWANLKLPDGTVWIGPLPHDDAKPGERDRMRRITSRGQMDEYKGSKQNYPRRVTPEEQADGLRLLLLRPRPIPLRYSGSPDPSGFPGGLYNSGRYLSYEMPLFLSRR